VDLLIAADVLDVALVAALAGWALVAAIAVIGRTRRRRRLGRIVRLERALYQLARAPFPQPPDRLRQLTGRLTPIELQELVRRGIPAPIASSLAKGLLARAGVERVRRVADGAEEHSVWTRDAAVEALAWAGDPHGYGALDRSLRSGSRRLAMSAVRLLARLDDRRAAAVLVTALRDRVCAPSRLAAAVDRMTVPRADLLGPLLAADSPAARFRGARLVGRLTAREWAPQVRELAGDGDPLVRRAAVETLGVFGDASDRVRLLAGFADPSPMVRVHAARAAVPFANETVADALTELLADREWIVRAAARDSLRRMAGVATAAAVRTLWHPDRFAANNAAEVLHRTGAATEAARRVLRGADAAADLVAILARYVAIGGAQFRDALLEALEEPDRRLLLARVRDAGRPE
jgi:HEAT repeat protein